MNVYGKLAKARVMLQRSELKKSGNNKFAGYTYFELGDFLPRINEIFEEVGLCSVVSFDKELAHLTIYDIDSDGSIEFTSPMGAANLKGCHEIQNIGAVETYSRRYLYMAAMEIVEHDALDSVTGSEQPKQEKKGSNNPQQVQQATTQTTPQNAKEAGAYVVSWGISKGKTLKDIYKNDKKQWKYLMENSTGDLKLAISIMLEALGEE